MKKYGDEPAVNGNGAGASAIGFVDFPAQVITFHSAHTFYSQFGTTINTIYKRMARWLPQLTHHFCDYAIYMLNRKLQVSQKWETNCRLVAYHWFRLGYKKNVLFWARSCYLRNSNRAFVDKGTPFSGHDMKWNWVTVRVSPVLIFFK